MKFPIGYSMIRLISNTSARSLFPFSLVVEHLLIFQSTSIKQFRSPLISSPRINSRVD